MDTIAPLLVYDLSVTFAAPSPPRRRHFARNESRVAAAIVKPRCWLSNKSIWKPVKLFRSDKTSTATVIGKNSAVMPRRATRCRQVSRHMRIHTRRTSRARARGVIYKLYPSRG